MIRVVANNLYVTTPGTGQSDETIQSAVDASSAGNTIHVEAGTYDQTANINKSVTLKGAAANATIIAPSTGSQQSVLTVSATDVTIDGVAIQVNQNDDGGIGGDNPIAPVGISATPATTTNFDGLTIKNTKITSIGNSPANWTGSPGLSVRSAGIVLVDSPSGGVPSITIDNNDIDIDSGTSFFQRAVWLAQLNADITNNKLVGTANDLIFQFPSGGSSLIDSNEFNGAHITGGGGLFIADPNSNSPINVTNNDFNPAAAVTVSQTSLLVNRNAVSGSPITVSGNSFNGSVIGVDVGGAQDVSVSGNTFTPKTGLTGLGLNFAHVRVNSQNISNNASTLTPINTTVDGNTFNAAAGSTGTAVVVQNTLAGSNFTGVNVGTTSDNIYASGITTGVSVAGGVVNVQDNITNTTTGIAATGGTTNVSSSTLTGNTTGSQPVVPLRYRSGPVTRSTVVRQVFR